MPAPEPVIIRGLALDGLTDGKLVIQATPQEVARITLGKRVMAVQPNATGKGDAPLRYLLHDPHLYNARGELVAIMRSMNSHRDIHDVSSFMFTGARHAVAGPLRVTIEADGVTA